MARQANPAIHPDRAQLGVPWLARLRWGLVLGQIGAALFAWEALEVAVPLAQVAIFIGVTAASNVFLLWNLGRDLALAHAAFGLLVSLDTVILTALLHATGGPSNPFSVLYLIHITLASLLLGARWTWAVTGLSILAYGSLFVWPLPALDEHAAHAMHAGHAAHAVTGYSAHLQGMWLAFTLTAILTASFVVALTAAIERRDREISTVRERADRTARLAAMTTLAAGAAHELGSPLATIAVAAEELERAVSRLPAEQVTDLVEDARLIRSQLRRCRQILDQMNAAAGEVTGEAPTPVSLRTLIASVRSEFATEEAARIEVDAEASDAVIVPHRAFARALHSLLQNALDAGGDHDVVRVLVAPDPAGGGLRVVVEDHGQGMATDVLERATEPFFTTKPAGKGMGMGLFLARALIEQLGGRLALTSIPGQGTQASLELPAAALVARGSRR